MKKSDTDWATPQGVMRNLGNRPVNIASRQESEEHRRKLMDPTTPEYAAHQRVLARRYKRERGS